MRPGRCPPALGSAISARATPALCPRPCRRRRQDPSAQQIPADCLLRAASSGSPFASVEVDEKEEKAVSLQQDMTHQQKNVTAEASAHRQRGKRGRSVDASSSNPSASASRKSLASKHFKAKEGQVLSSAGKHKIPKQKARTAKQSSSPEVPPRPAWLASVLVDHGLILVLFETPSGFAIFTMLEQDLRGPDAMENVWANFGVDYRVKDFVCLSEFKEFKDNSSAINQDTGVSRGLADLIRKWHLPGQKMAVGKPEYKEIIERSLGIPCLFDEIVMEVMWGLKNLMHFLVPQEKLKLRNEDRLPMSQGLKMILNRYGFDVKPEMVNDRIILMACLLLDCEYCDVKNCKPLRMAGEHLNDVSGINSEDWDLMKLATALKVMYYPAETTTAEKEMFTPEELSKLDNDAHKYKNKINKGLSLTVYNEMVEARTYIRRTQITLKYFLPEIHEPGSPDPVIRQE